MSRVPEALYEVFKIDFADAEAERIADLVWTKAFDEAMELLLTLMPGGKEQAFAYGFVKGSAAQRQGLSPEGLDSFSTELLQELKELGSEKLAKLASILVEWLQYREAKSEVAMLLEAARFGYLIGAVREYKRQQIKEAIRDLLWGRRS